jgi:uncharacterized lipoprotein YddW (UPF0748 family)
MAISSFWGALLGALWAGDLAGEAPREVRAIWVTRWDFRSEADVRRIVERCAALGLNRIYFQVRGQADAFYRSRLEPWGEELGGRDPGFDPLEVALEAARARRIELHAWVNVLAGWKGKTPPRSQKHVAHEHPEWFLLDRDGKRHLLSSHYTMLNPCLPEVRRHLVSVLLDIVERYPVDGLHLDYIRFIIVEARTRGIVPYDPYTLSLFRKRTGGFPIRHPDEWDLFRREAVDTLVREIAAATRKARPRLKLTAAVIGDFERGRKLFFQDAVKWRAEGWVDELVPMTYTADAGHFAAQAKAALEAAGRACVVAGIGVHEIGDARTLSRQIEICRALEAGGYSLFAYSSLFPNAAGKQSLALAESLRAALIELNRHGATASIAPPRPAPRSEPSPAGTLSPCAPGKAPAGAR